MSIGRDGLRHAGGTSITRCCGREAIPPRVGSASVTEDGTPITESNFPDAELVCPECERTWGDGCDHDHVVVEHSDFETELDDTDSMWYRGVCRDCDERVNVLMEIGDIRLVELGESETSPQASDQ